MKKVLILSSLLLSLGALADITPEAPTPVDAPEVEANFVIKGLSSMHAKCARAKAKYDNAEEAKIQWEAVQPDCAKLPAVPVVPETQDLPNKDL